VERFLATDLDGTFIGDDAAMHALWANLAAADIGIVFSTGRHLPSIESFYAEHDITWRAAACICMVGTEIWLHTESGYRLDESWSKHISDAWDKAAVEEILQAIPGVTMQPAEWQSRFKSSYYLEVDAAAALARIHNELAERGLNAKVVYSARRFLDLLPHRSGKGGAVSWLAGAVDVAPDSVITAGDTGNDLDMMRADLGFRCVAVGNASEELSRVREPQIYHATAEYAAGIQEGLVHYGWLPAAPNNE